VESSYLPPQQSPVQCDELFWLLGQQLAFGWQHADPGLQHAAPEAASAETVNSDAAIRAKIVAFMEIFLSV
jgi:hypothetical protein